MLSSAFKRRTENQIPGGPARAARLAREDPNFSDMWQDLTDCSQVLDYLVSLPVPSLTRYREYKEAYEALEKEIHDYLATAR